MKTRERIPGAWASLEVLSRGKSILAQAGFLPHPHGTLKETWDWGNYFHLGFAGVCVMWAESLLKTLNQPHVGSAYLTLCSNSNACQRCGSLSQIQRRNMATVCTKVRPQLAAFRIQGGPWGMESAFPQASLCAQTASVAQWGSGVREQGKGSLYH